jgi:hypothetical protein
MQIISVGDVIGDSCKLRNCRMFFAKAELFMWKETVLCDINGQSVSDDSFE